MPSKSSSNDCVEVGPPEKTASWSFRSMQRDSTVNAVESEGNNEAEESEHDEDQDMNESVTTGGASRKRPGSSLVKSNAKKAKTAVVSQRPEPSGKGDDYDDLCWRANRMASSLRMETKQAKLELSKMQAERDEALVTGKLLQKKLKSQQANEAAREVKDAADLKATVQEMKVQLKAEMEKKHRTSNELKDKRHKEELARYKENTEIARGAAKDAKAEAKDLRPEHSRLLQKRDKKIDQLKQNQATLEGVADQLKREKTQVYTDKEALSKALASSSDEVIDLQDHVKKLENEVTKAKALNASDEKELERVKRGFAADKRTWDVKWQIQYDNAQNSARRASDIQRSLSTITRALNEAILKRDEYETKLKDVEAENRVLRNSVSKGDDSKQAIQR